MQLRPSAMKLGRESKSSDFKARHHLGLGEFRQCLYFPWLSSIAFFCPLFHELCISLLFLNIAFLLAPFKTSFFSKGGVLQGHFGSFRVALRSHAQPRGRRNHRRAQRRSGAGPWRRPGDHVALEAAEALPVTLFPTIMEGK